MADAAGELELDYEHPVEPSRDRNCVLANMVQYFTRIVTRVFPRKKTVPLTFKCEVTYRTGVDPCSANE